MRKVFQIIVILVLLMPFVFNGAVSIYGNLAVILLGLIVLAGLSLPNPYILVQKTTINIALSVVVLLTIFVSIFSLVFTWSLIDMIWWLSYLVIFFIFQEIGKDKRTLVFISKTFVILSSFFVILSLGRFVEIGLIANAKVQGIVANSDIYASFLIIPFLLSLHFIFQKNSVWQKRLWYVSGAILLTGLVLTFSWSAWSSILVAIVLTLVIFWQNLKKIISTGKVITILKPIGLLVAISFIVFCTVWYLARQTVISKSPDELNKVSQEALISTQDDSLKACLNSFSSAWNVFLHAPMTGFGSGLYTEAIRIYETNPDYGLPLNPPTWLMRLLVENGIIATIIIILFLIIFFKDLAEKIRQQADLNWLTITLFVSLFAITIHSLIDSGWTNTFLLLVFFIFAGSLYGHLSDFQDQKKIKVKHLGEWFNCTLLIVLILGSIVSIQLLRADLARDEGNKFFEGKNTEYAVKKYFQAVSYNSHDPLTWYSLWKVHFTLGEYDLAKKYIGKAMEIFPENVLYRKALEMTEKELGDRVN